MSKKTIFIVLGVVFALILLCGLCGVGSILFFSSVMKEGFEVRETRIHEMCVASKDFSESDYKKFFSADYINRNSFTDTSNLLGQAFPSEFDCNDLKDSGVISLFGSGESLNVSTVNGESTIEFSKNNITFTFEEVEGTYKVVSTTVVN